MSEELGKGTPKQSPGSNRQAQTSGRFSVKTIQGWLIAVAVVLGLMLLGLVSRVMACLSTTIPEPNLWLLGILFLGVVTLLAVVVWGLVTLAREDF